MSELRAAAEEAIDLMLQEGVPMDADHPRRIVYNRLNAAINGPELDSDRWEVVRVKKQAQPVPDLGQTLTEDDIRAFEFSQLMQGNWVQTWPVVEKGKKR